MLKKLIRLVFASVGAAVGYGVFQLVKYLIGFANVPPDIAFTEGQQIIAAIIFAIIFAILFFRLVPTISKQSKRAAKNIERDLQGVAANELVLGTFGLITGLIIAFLISDIFKDIKIFFLSLTANSKKLAAFRVKEPKLIKFSIVNGVLENFLIVNRKTKFKNFFTYLKEELYSCDSFCFIVSFIKYHCHGKIKF